MKEKLTALREHLARVLDLEYAAFVLSWDQEVNMPPGGVNSRGDQIARLQSLAHRYYTDEEVGQLLEDLSEHLDELDPASDEASIIRVNRREFGKLIRVPSDFVSDMAKAATLGKQAWREARENDDFSHFQPHLERLVDLRIQYADFFKPFDNRYDPLLDQFEPGLTQSYIASVFEGLKPHLKTMIAAIAENADAVDGEAVRRHVDEARQIAFSRDVTEALGYDYNRGRIDLSTHPFTTRFSMDDVRITTRVRLEDPLDSLMSSIHEAGHAMHGQSISRTLYRTKLDLGRAMAISESQSRFYENVVGRSRAFWQYWYPHLQTAYAPTFDDVDEETFWRGANRVEAGLARVEADEVTYGMHIMLRFELEDDLINERVKVADLPDIWRSKMDEYLGVVPPTDTTGVMQDIHWSMGMIGYFPDYLLGSILSVQLWDRMQADHPGIEDEISRGEFENLLTWQQEHVMQHGRKFTLPELTERVTGGPLRWEPYVDYLRDRYGSVYGIT